MTELNINALVERVTEKIYEKDPSLMDRYGEKGWAKCIEDNHHHFKHLETAYDLNNVQFFTDYAVWLDGILRKFGMSTQLLIDNFNLISELLEEELKTKEIPELSAYIHYLHSANEVLIEQTTAAKS